MKENTLGVLIIILVIGLISWNIYLPTKVLKDISGTWRSDKENKYQVTFDSFGNVVEGYEDNISSGTFNIERLPINKFILNTNFPEEFHYIINKVDKNKLEITDLKTKNSFSFSKSN